MGWMDCLVNQRLETCLFCKLKIIQNDRLVKQIIMLSKYNGKYWEKKVSQVFSWNLAITFI